jgi:hypothetical protein
VEIFAEIGIFVEGEIFTEVGIVPGGVGYSQKSGYS